MYYSETGGFMIQMLFLCCIFITLSSLTFGATINSNDCPDPACCKPSRGPSSCSLSSDACWSSCQKTCPCGARVTCGRVSRQGIFCIIGEANAGETPCYNHDMSCDEFLRINDPCNDPPCWDTDLQNAMCGSACTGQN
jgi:hypothetical protein